MKGTFQNKLSRLFAIYFLVLAIAYFPVMFSYFSMGELIRNELVLLGLFSLVLLFISVGLYKNWLKDKAVALLFVPGLILGLEVLSRITIHVVNPSLIPFFEKHAYRSYEENEVFQAHPFLQFKGKENTLNISKKVLPYNNVGFPGKDYSVDKNEVVKRIFCIGASTTAYGYPEKLDSILNEKRPGEYEVLNAALPWYTTAHSLINFELNLLHYEPDEIVINHAWNDELAREAGEYKFDYSHILKPYETKSKWDRYLVRWSVNYRYLKYNLMDVSEFNYLDDAIVHKRVNEKNYLDLSELTSYHRNIKTMIAIAKSYGIKVHLVTMPTYKNEEILLGKYRKHIHQCNDELRSQADQDTTISFIDLTQTFPEDSTVFIDIAHCTDYGKLLKAQLISEYILE